MPRRSNFQHPAPRNGAAQTRLNTIINDAIRGRKDVNAFQAFQGSEFTPLMLAVQWRNWNVQCATEEYSADKVALLLQRGADPNLRSPSDGESALFFAVKYGDLRTVELLLQANADVGIRDTKFNKTALYNACETCDVEIVKRLLACGVSAKERQAKIFDTNIEGIPVNAAECMLMSDPEVAYFSWQILEPPDFEDWIKVFEMLLLAGAELGQPAMDYASNRLAGVKNGNAMDHRDFLVYAALGLEYPEQPRTRAVRPKHAPPPDRHWFAAAASPAQPEAADAPPDRPDAAPWDEHVNQAQLYECTGSSAEGIVGGAQEHGPAAMSMEQLVQELEALQLEASASQDRAQLEAHLTAQMQRTRALRGTKTAEGEAEEEDPIAFFLDTACAQTVVGTSHVILCPSAGPACAPVVINGVPVLAFLSNISSLTVVSTAFADRAGLVYSDMRPTKSEAVHDANGNPLDLRLVEAMPITLAGDVEVTVRTAVVMDTFQRGVQLGQDFFRLAVHCRVDVLQDPDKTGTDPGGMYETQPDGGPDRVWLTPDTAGRVEELRFHSVGGKTARVPIVHVRDGAAGTVLVKADAKLDACAWCGKPFPGLRLCPVCKQSDGSRVCYCSSACQRADWPGHKLLPPHQK